MKQVYTTFLDVEIKLKDCGIINTGSDVIRGRNVYHYGEIPEIKTETITSDFATYLEHKWLLHSKKKERRGRILLYILRPNNAVLKLYEDEIESVTGYRKAKVVDNPEWKYLYKDLGFNELTELIFNREQELKSMLLRNEG